MTGNRLTASLESLFGSAVLEHQGFVVGSKARTKRSLEKQTPCSLQCPTISRKSHYQPNLNAREVGVSSSVALRHVLAGLLHKKTMLSMS